MVAPAHAHTIVWSRVRRVVDGEIPVLLHGAVGTACVCGPVCCRYMFERRPALLVYVVSEESAELESDALSYWWQAEDTEYDRLGFNAASDRKKSLARAGHKGRHMGKRQWLRDGRETRTNGHRFDRLILIGM